MSEVYQSIIHSIYAKYNPAKVEDVQELLKKYKGKEKQLLDLICEKYNVPDEELNTLIAEYNTTFPQKKSKWKYVFWVVVILIIIGLIIGFVAFFVENNTEVSNKSEANPATSIEEPIGKIQSDKIERSETIESFFIPEQDYNKVTFHMPDKTTGGKTSMTRTVYYINKNGKYDRMDAIYVDGVFGSVNTLTLEFSPTEVKMTNSISTNIVETNIKEEYNPASILLKLPMENESINWTFRDFSGDDIKCSSAWTTVTFNGEERKAIKLTKKVDVDMEEIEYYVHGIGLWKVDVSGEHGVQTMYEFDKLDKDLDAVSYTNQSINSNYPKTSDDKFDNKDANIKYIVKSKSFFYDLPNETSIRKAYLVEDEVIYSSQEENGFVYTEFVNPVGKETKGWVKKNTLLIDK
jgi:hypothetical protein